MFNLYGYIRIRSSLHQELEYSLMKICNKSLILNGLIKEHLGYGRIKHHLGYIHDNFNNLGYRHDNFYHGLIKETQ